MTDVKKGLHIPADATWGMINRVVTDLRSESRRSSERLNQGLLGDGLRILNRDNGWNEVVLLRDGYHGWVQEKSVLTCTRERCLAYMEDAVHRVEKPLAQAYGAMGPGAVPSGKLPFSLKVKVADRKNGWAAVCLPDDRIWWVRETDLLAPKDQPGPDAAGIAHCLDIIKTFIGTPYLWGGCTPFGYDCSGLAQAMWAMMGVNLGRDARDQYHQGAEVEITAGMKNINPGDLLFFGSREDPAENKPLKVPHVAVSLGGTEYIHANASTWSVALNSFNIESPIFRQDLLDDLIMVRRFAHC